jgi:hypothetical protein
MGSKDFVGIDVSCEIEYHALCERLGPLITLQKFISMKNPNWSEDEVTYWTSIAEGGKARETRWKEAQRNPTPIRSTQLCLGNQIIGVGVRVRSISLRYTMIVMMRIQSSPMMIVTLAQRLVIVTIAQRIAMMTLA